MLHSPTIAEADGLAPAGGRPDLSSFRAAYARATDPAEVIRAVYRRIAASAHEHVWITLLPIEAALGMLAAASARRSGGDVLPLFGVPFAVKDNIDVAGLPTTAGCPAYAYTPDAHAVVVERLVAAGAIPVGKTNLDQFATGLSGTRSPYGSPACVFDRRFIAGGSSSGSAVAVAAGLVPVALATDTAGSGRVPAACNGLVGLKPTRGLLSTRGLVPAARSLDCVSVLATSVTDAVAVARIAAGFDPEDAFSRQAPAATWSAQGFPDRVRFGLPRAGQLDFLGDTAAARLFQAAIERLEAIGGVRVEFDYAPFRAAADLLYGGPWLAERLAAIEPFAGAHHSAMNPVVRDVILPARRIPAVDAFRGYYALRQLKREAEPVWREIDVMLLPTAPTIYRIEEMQADPVRLNSNLGLYTNFVNLMDLSAVAVPAGFRPNGLPFGVTLVGRAFQDGAIAALGARFAGGTLDVCGPSPRTATEGPARIAVAVAGAHLSGQPLNHQLRERDGLLRRRTRTAAGYALYALTGGAPARPGLIREPGARGYIEVEIWDLPAIGFAALVDQIPPPLGIGTVTLEDGHQVKGFLCEPYALQGALDITGFGGWRAYLASLAPAHQPASSHQPAS